MRCSEEGKASRECLTGLMAKVVLLCGIPGVGKSSLSRALEDVLHIEYDGVEDTLDEDGPEGWKQTRSVVLERLASLLHEDSHNCVILDDNFYLRSMRKQVYQICQQSLATPKFGIVWLTAPLDVCLKHNERRDLDRRIPSEIIRRMASRIEPPGKAPFEKAVLEIATEKLSLSEQTVLVRNFIHNDLQLVEEFLDPAIEEERKEQERRLTRESSAHQLDQILRRCVKSLAQADPQRFAKVANQRRKEMLVSKDYIERPINDILEAFVDGLGLNASDNELAHSILKENEF